MADVSLYIHIPFCQQKCAYCDFVSVPGRDSDHARYLLALEKDMHARVKQYGRMSVKTVYIGGGTPSVVPSGAIMHLLAMTRALCDLDDRAEITIEANPGTLTVDKLRDYRDAGVNRLSLGMQTANERLLKMLGRIHTNDDVKQAFDRARTVGLDNLSLDLMYALPTQTMAEWVDTLKFALSLEPAHLSCYSLILEDGTPLATRVASGELPCPDDEAALTMQHGAERIVKKRGFARYEISNYALPGRECRHNLVYWNRGNYLGIGCAAHSLMDGERFANTSHLDAYLAGERTASSEVISESGAREEAILLGTRTREGIPLSLVPNEAAIDKLRALGLIEIARDRLVLTAKGLDVQSAVVLELISSTP